MVRLQRHCRARQWHRRYPFNPTMVRLQRSPLGHRGGYSDTFQSHYGAIATSLKPLSHALKPIFQSHYGAIATHPKKVDERFHSLLSIPLWCDCNLFLATILARRCSSFNPTMVRLQPVTSSAYGKKRRSFQSHYGAIATVRSAMGAGSLVAFQSHYGAIATVIAGWMWDVRQYFQSHYGAIATPHTV